VIKLGKTRQDRSRNTGTGEGGKSRRRRSLLICDDSSHRLQFAIGPISGSHLMSGKLREYCLIVEGAYLSESEAEHALRDPFIEDWVEQTGHFKIHNMNEIQITAGVTLGSLGVVMLDDRLFEIASADADHPLTELKAKGVAEALRRQDMFDEVKVKPRDEELVESHDENEET
jgi:hypothetical protein